MDAKNESKAAIEQEYVDAAIDEKADEKTVKESATITVLKKVWDKFTTLLTILLVLFAIYCTLGVVNQAKTGELFFPFGYRPVTILSGSMKEALKPGALVIVEETKDVEVGDIIFFIDEDGYPIIHRCVGINHNGDYVTKGDFNPKEDYEPVTPERLQGKVVVTMNWLSVIVGVFI